ncbi:MAG: DNA topoisomerase III [Oscillospiraceae bacterium]|nr:DNA topoisomerase III [Oscillospiraceae bacterium]
MGKSLVLAEKPSVARELAGVLGCRGGQNGYYEGGKYIVTWALGHLVTLADPAAYDKRWEKWDMDTLPMLPRSMKLEVIRQSSRQFGTVKQLMNRQDVGDVIIATDAGREGELVARWIIIKAGCKKPAKRLWISSHTDRSIREGFSKLRPAGEYENLFLSAQARSQADWLVGLNVTRALTCRYNAQLSAGRVQTPTLAMIVRREEEIRTFKSVPFSTVRIKLDGFEASWHRNGSGRIFDDAEARRLKDRLEGQTASVTAVKLTRHTVPPPPAYDLTQLQRDANKKYAYTAKETLDVCQSLYERHKLLTYPRTDSRYISKDIVPSLRERLLAAGQGELKDAVRSLLKSPLRTQYLVNDAKVTDHHAIIPTEEQASLWDLSGQEQNIYEMAARQFICTMMPPYVYETAEVSLAAAGETFTARFRTVLDPGWRSLSAAPSEDEDEDGEEFSVGPRAPEKGARLPIREVRTVPGKTSPPARYTEATLLTAMEHPVGDNGRKITGSLGTPATRADIIDRLFTAFYAERRGREIVPTSKGKQLISLAPPQLLSAELTAKWEERLARIASGAERDTAFIEDMRSFASSLVDQVKAAVGKYVHDNATRQNCPDCGAVLLRVKGKHGEMLVCSDRECGYRKSVSRATNARCPNCHKKMELRGSGDSQIFACVCGYREKLSAFKERTAGKSAGKADVRRYMEKQKNSGSGGSSAMAEQLAKWLENNRGHDTK